MEIQKDANVYENRRLFSINALGISSSGNDKLWQLAEPGELCLQFVQNICERNNALRLRLVTDTS